MARIYATACEKQGKNFNTVPAKLKAQVKAILEADGYVIGADGVVSLAPVEVEEEEAPAEEVEAEVEAKDETPAE